MPAIPWRSFSAVEPDRQYLAMASRLPLMADAFARLTEAQVRT
jgi:hypothetical protein